MGFLLRFPFNETLAMVHDVILIAIIFFSCFRVCLFFKVGMISKDYTAAKLLYYHLRDGQAKANAILVDIIFDIKLIEHLSNIFRVFESDTLISDSYFKNLYSLMKVWFILFLTKSSL